MSHRAWHAIMPSRWLTVTALVVATGLAGACSESGGSASRACAIFDRSYAAWTVVGEAPQTASTPSQLRHLTVANTVFLQHLDQATAESGATPLASALQATAASIRTLNGDISHGRANGPASGHAIAATTRALTVSVAAVRQTCPRV